MEKHSGIQTSFLLMLLEWEEGNDQEHLLELLNPGFCTIGWADYVELQIGEKMCIKFCKWKLQPYLLLTPKCVNWEYYMSEWSKCWPCEPYDPCELAVVEKMPCVVWRFRVTHRILGKGGSDGWSIDKSVHETQSCWNFLGMGRGVVVPMYHLRLNMASKPHIFLAWSRKDAVFSEQEHACRRHAIGYPALSDSHWLTIYLFLYSTRLLTLGSSRVPGCIGRPGCSIYLFSTQH
jgi:hypothetical protein